MTSRVIAESLHPNPKVYSIVQSFRSGIQPNAMTAVFTNASNMKTHPDPQMIQAMEDTWASRLNANPRLYNATKFRFVGITESADSNSNSGSAWALQVGLTDYKSFLGTNMSAHVDKLQKDGVEQHGDSSAFLADPLGVGACVLTQDKQLVFIKRSEHVGEAPGLYDVPGGHPEPSELSEFTENDVEWISRARPEAVVHELFDSIKREIIEEVNIPQEDLEPPFLTALIRNHTSAGRVSACFLFRTKLSAEQVQARYNLGSQDAFESTALKFVHVDDLGTIDTTAFAPACVGAIYCLLDGNLLD
eukprot:GFYU01003523.1.p1 GENE.GFYU01003523.1~~GFYU01003523.1.p1  ORF type:complete len:304 (+),score=44.09 GFYU01003523.1:93-1004(+)